MKKHIKAILWKLFPIQAEQWRACRSLIRDPNSYIHTTGWYRSMQTKAPVNQDGLPIPWMNFGIIKFLEERLNRSLHIFEFGTGYSTLFYSRHVDSVRSVEYDEKWYNTLSSQKPKNVELLFRENDVDGVYCRAIQESDETYDVVVVDGRDRVNCVKQSIDHLSEAGVILLDDSHRQEYSEAIEYAQEKGFRHISFEGIKATENKVDRTTIFYRTNNCFGI